MTKAMTATPTGRMWSLVVDWQDESLPWTAADGWHPLLLPRLTELNDKARPREGAMCVAPFIPDNWFQMAEYMAQADGVRASVCFDLVRAAMVCRLDTMEVVLE